jgi:hypothetical protein
MHDDADFIAIRVPKAAKIKRGKLTMLEGNDLVDPAISPEGHRATKAFAWIASPKLKNRR